jgi:hypothetical protein
MEGNLANAITCAGKLNKGDLCDLLAYVQSRVTRLTGQGTMAKPGGRQNGAKRQKPKAKDAKKKQKVSVYKDIPEYRTFKANEKMLKTFLFSRTNVDERKLSFWTSTAVLTKPGVISDFLESRQCWFRVKSTLQSSIDTAAGDGSSSPVTASASGGAGDGVEEGKADRSGIRA